MSEDEAFVAIVEKWIAEALAERPADFLALVRQLPGVDPILIHRILASRSTFGTAAARALLHDAQNHPKQSRSAHPALVPHPLDYNWRYGTLAIRTLSQLAKRFPSDAGCTALIGAPTLVRPLLEQSPSHDLHLIDRDPLWQPAFRDISLHTLDVATDPCPEQLVGRADLVIIDPPWYTNGYANFMWFGRQLLKRSGLLAVSVLPIGTRPRANDDREALNELAAQHGLQLVEEHTAVLSYATPPFERNALLAAGIRAPLEEWRVADLWLFSAVHESTAERPIARNSYDWHEVRFDEVRIRFDSRANSGSMALDTLIRGDVLPSVSARFPGRDRATVWTSGNRVFACENSAALYHLCHNTPWHSTNGFDNSAIGNRELAVLAPLVRIIDQELLEYGNRK